MPANIKLDVTKFHEVRDAARRLTVFRHLHQDHILVNFIQLLDLAKDPTPDLAKLTDLYHQLTCQLFNIIEYSDSPAACDAWQNYLLDLILDADNPFTRQAGSGSLDINSAMSKAGQNDLRCLEQLFRLDGCQLRTTIAELISSISEITSQPALAQNWPIWDISINLNADCLTPILCKRKLLKQHLLETADWGNCLNQLVNYYSTAGVGIFGRYWAFRWVNQDMRHHFQPVAAPESIRLNDLIGYESEKKEIRRNTEKLLHGYPANNILLYGDRGTGKSSTVKALINEYGPQGLRLIEVPRQHLADFPIIIQQLRNRPQYFILFVDDLSFEEHEVEYKHLKAILEGGLESRPANVLIYATSNRRHLIKERMSDRQIISHHEADDEVRRNDTVQEKLSLADRFGLTIIFPSPDQERYLAIVEGLARQRGITINNDDLRRQALQWEVWHNGRSGRTARQFIDDLMGELALN